MCPRLAQNGEFMCPDDPTARDSWQMWTEGDTYQWSYFTPHDLRGMIALRSSEQAFIDALELYFENHVKWFESHNGQNGGEVLPNPYYWPGNEISLVDVYYFSLVNCVRTQYWVRRVLPMHFTSSPHGIPGNDDYGTLSAFALFTAIGIYPKSGSTQYFIGSPTVTTATLFLIGYDKLSHVQTDAADRYPQIKVITYNNSDVNVYVSRLKVNGKDHLQPYLEYTDLVGKGGGGSVLEFFMSDEPYSALCSA